MSRSTNIEIEVAGRTIRARLMNPQVVELVCSHLPLTNFALHPNVSGAGFLLPTMITYTGESYMVDRHPGAVYLYAPGQSIVFTCGDTNESAPVNKFAEVLEEDMSELLTIGKLVYDHTLATVEHKVIGATARLDGAHDLPSRELPPPDALRVIGRWRKAEALFLAEARRALSGEPDEISASFSGVIPSGMGTGGNILPVWMHQWSYLMTDGPNTLYRFVTDTEIPHMTLPIMVDLSRNHLLRPFNHFDFLGDLGLIKFKTWGAIYSAALDDLNSLEEFKRLTIALLTLVNLYHRRVQSRFPFYLGQAFSRGGKDRNTRLDQSLGF
uniref:Mikimopine synthase n=1 Tax=Nicotiana glauca TaxID=4090 RepID=Q8S951_NICGL|nr:mikimopine synthase [Nicotiana glauca]